MVHTRAYHRIGETLYSSLSIKWSSLSFVAKIGSSWLNWSHFGILRVVDFYEAPRTCEEKAKDPSNKCIRWSYYVWFRWLSFWTSGRRAAAMIAKATPMGSTLETEIVCSFSFYLLFFWVPFLTVKQSSSFCSKFSSLILWHFLTFSLSLFLAFHLQCFLYCLWFRCRAVYRTNSMQKGDSKLPVTPFSDAWEMIPTSYMQKSMHSLAEETAA